MPTKIRFSLRTVVLVALVAVAVFLVARWTRMQLAIDSCLDRGGRWDYEQGVCVDPRPYSDEPSTLEE
ncbi:MAG: hypothetical protein DRJ61_07660 [Acidobacteria bacterium]|nr:MAG: hypothetical protein DRJ65_04970 [Acidobacteriota bacterium]RLE33236.1 MAG: hypothetical protein DRJ61_07660 [Acidobacteriota bacterium]